MLKNIYKKMMYALPLVAALTACDSNREEYPKPKSISIAGFTTNCNPAPVRLLNTDDKPGYDTIDCGTSRWPVFYARGYVGYKENNAITMSEKTERLLVTLETTLEDLQTSLKEDEQKFRK